ncbi:MAG: methionine adenosyltransferase [Methanosarcinaceae archaeon]|nr:methionine adenosyltransferase [Methanosarcinaceae archaeon]
MVRNIVVERSNSVAMEKKQIEIVERKGVGHPDSIADGIAESVSQALCAEYIKRYDCVLHHNTDETQIVAGRSNPAFGGGEVIKPIYILLVGRATKEFNGDEFPADAVALKAARKYLKNTVESLNIDSDVIIDCKLGQGSSDLCNVFSRNENANILPLANDTSFGVGHAPFSELETLVYETERLLIDDLKNKKRIKAIGEDIKVMGVRNKDEIDLTVCSGFVGRYVDDIDSYVSISEEVKDYIEGLANDLTQRKTNVYLNAADDISAESVFLTVTGTSAEMGDDGSVGRGNRSNGLITPGRPMSMEATSGKNPINHIGKIYNLLSREIAKRTAEEIDGIDDIYINILSQIGKPIDKPLVASAQIIPESGANFNKIQKEAESVIDEELADIGSFMKRLINGEFKTF